MEMRDWLRRLGRLTWLLAIVPAVAVVGAVGVGLARAPDYAATATVTLSAPGGMASGAAINATTTAYANAVDDEGVLRSASWNSDIPAAEIGASTEAARAADSAEVTIEYSGGRRGGQVERMLEELSAAAVDAVYAPHLRIAAARITQSQRRVDAAEKKVDKLRDETGSDAPLEEYKAQSSQVSQLKTQIATAKAERTSTAGLEGALTEAQEELDDRAAIAAKFEGPMEEATKTREGLQLAKDEQADLQARKSALSSAEAVSVTDPVPASRTPIVLRLAVSAAVVGFGLVVVLLLVVSLLRSVPLPNPFGAVQPQRQVRTSG